MQQVNFADYFEWGYVSEKQNNRKIKVLGSIQKGVEKVNTMCYTPNINGLLNLKKCIPM